MEKTFVDYYLLGSYDLLLDHYCTVKHLDKLNSFEQCLLAECCLKRDRVKDAQRVTSFIQSQAKQNDFLEKNTSDRKRYFDLIINLNMKKKSEENTAEGSGEDSSDEEKESNEGERRQG
jgi:hypothetical protein